MLQRTLDALGPLPVHVVATTGGIVDPEELTNDIASTFGLRNPDRPSRQ